jgi:hypothetical protein
MYSARYASETIQAALQSGDLSEEAFKPYERTLRSGVEIWYEFIRLYYKLLPLFTLFIQSEYRVEILRLLQGEVFNRQDVRVLDVMRRYIEVVEKNESHVFRGQLSDIPIEDILNAARTQWRSAARSPGNPRRIHAACDLLSTSWPEEGNHAAVIPRPMVDSAWTHTSSDSSEMQPCGKSGLCRPCNWRWQPRLRTPMKTSGFRRTRP